MGCSPFAELLKALDDANLVTALGEGPTICFAPSEKEVPLSESNEALLSRSDRLWELIQQCTLDCSATRGAPQGTRFQSGVQRGCLRKSVPTVEFG